MTKGPRPDNLAGVSQAIAAASSKDAATKLVLLERRNFPIAIVAMIVALASSSAFGQGSPGTTPKKMQREQLVSPGVVVEKVDKGSAAEQAGIKKGDVILSWSRAGKAKY